MNILEISAVLIALSSLVMATVAVAQLMSLKRIQRRLETTIQRTNRALERLNKAAASVEDIVRHASRLERRLHRTVDGLLDRVESPLRLLSAVLASARAGITSWRNAGRHAARDGSASPQRAMAEEGGQP